jgi:nitroimidazol reductase NimA-like FMN-containing flavoprotein (pyridoxamine 5'-phosphate oxidase superfamily)
MSKQNWKQEIDGYVKNVPFAALAYVRSDGTPVQRTLGSFARHDINLFFSTRIDAAKVKEIENNPRVSFLFEADNQQLPAWKNVLVIGKAAPVTGDSELKLATELLSARNPRFKERVSKDGLKDTQVFRLQTEEIQFLDFAKGQGHLQKISLPEREEV